MTSKVQLGSVVQFNPESRARCKDPCYVGAMSVTRGGKSEYRMMPLEGVHAGKLFTYTLRMGVVIDRFCKPVKKTAAQLAAAEQMYRAATNDRADRELAGYGILRSIEPGDLVTITIRGAKATRYEFKVFEVDFKKNRLKGFQQGMTNPGSRMGWVNVAHSDVTVTMHTKGYFDPSKDGVGQLHETRKAAATTKRVATRKRRQELQDIFGSL